MTMNSAGTQFYADPATELAMAGANAGRKSRRSLAQSFGVGWAVCKFRTALREKKFFYLSKPFRLTNPAY
jgi:hypothetical protein